MKTKTSTVQKPVIIVLSADNDTEGFKWLSDGWHTLKSAQTPHAKSLMAKARQAIEDGENVLDVIKKLEEAGFEIVRQ